MGLPETVTAALWLQPDIDSGRWSLMKESPPEAARRLQPLDYQISELIRTLPQVMLRPSGDGLKPAPRAVVSIGVARSGHYLSVGHLSKNPGFWANAYAAGPPSAQLAEVQYRCDPTCRLTLLAPMQYSALAAATFAGAAVDVAMLPRPLVYQVGRPQNGQHMSRRSA